MPGKRRNPEEKMAKLIEAVGLTLREKGYVGIGVNKVALTAGVSKSMIYTYFGNLNGLLKVYIQRKDYWLPYFEQLELPANPSTADLKALFIKILQDQYRFFYAEKEMQKLIQWQIGQYNPLMRAISQMREKEGVRLLGLTDGHFRDSGISLKAVVALLVGGIYFIVLHDSAGAGSVSGIDISEEKDFELIVRTIGQILEWAFGAAENS